MSDTTNDAGSPIESFLPADMDENAKNNFLKEFKGDDGPTRLVQNYLQTKSSINRMLNERGKIPDSPDGYTVETESDQVKAALDFLRAPLHQAKVSTAVFDEIQAGLEKFSEDTHARQERVREETLNRWKDERIREHGQKSFEDRMAQVEEAYQSLALSDDTRQVFDALGVVYEPAIHDLLFAIGQKSQDGQIPMSQAEPKQPSMSLKDAQRELDKVLQAIPDMPKDSAEAEQARADVMRLGKIIVARKGSPEPAEG